MQKRGNYLYEDLGVKLPSFFSRWYLDPVSISAVTMQL